MDDRYYNFLKWTAIVIAVVVFATLLYNTFVVGRDPGDTAYFEGEQFFADGIYDRAIEKYDQAIRDNPQHTYAMRGRARALVKLGRYSQAIREFDAIIAMEPSLGVTYANRGIAHDFAGHYEKAIDDYEKAIALDPELTEGPHWLTRFLRNQPDKPPGIADRAGYLKQQLALPPEQRLLRVPEIDEAQRPYKQ